MCSTLMVPNNKCFSRPELTCTLGGVPPSIARANLFMCYLD